MKAANTFEHSRGLQYYSNYMQFFDEKKKLKKTKFQAEISYSETKQQNLFQRTWRGNHWYATTTINTRKFFLLHHPPPKEDNLFNSVTLPNPYLTLPTTETPITSRIHLLVSWTEHRRISTTKITTTYFPLAKNISTFSEQIHTQSSKCNSIHGKFTYYLNHNSARYRWVLRVTTPKKHPMKTHNTI